MADLSALLLASLTPDTRKQAEQGLSTLSTQQGFLTHLLQLVLEPTQNRAVRLSGSIYLKNIAKLRWEEVRRAQCHQQSYEPTLLDRSRMSNLYWSQTRLRCEHN